MKPVRVLIAAVCLAIACMTANAEPVSVLVMDVGGLGDLVAPRLEDPARFSTVERLNINGILPTWDAISSYDSLLVYSQSVPADPVALGNLLADYVDAGGHLVLAASDFTTGWQLQGRIMTAGYSPLTAGAGIALAGPLTAVVPTDPIFDGIGIAAVMPSSPLNGGTAGLDATATLLATDANSVNIVARNSAGNVIGVNIYPGLAVYHGDPVYEYELLNSDDYFALLQNALVPQSGAVIPEPCTVLLFASATAGGILAARRKKR